jgi:hypothetical protein
MKGGDRYARNLHSGHCSLLCHPVYCGCSACFVDTGVSRPQYGETRAGVLQEVGKRYRYSRNWNRRPYYRSYAYRPYAYRPYGYYRPYSYYGYGYPYYRRPGISLWFGF